MSRGTVEAARALLETFRSLANPDETGANQVEIREFLHGNDNIHVRGVSAITKIPKGAAVLKIPSEYSITAKDVVGDRFDSGPDSPGHSVMDGRTKLGFWLAEKKREWYDHPARKLSPTQRYWRDAINAYPTLDDYASRGIPLAAPEEDLSRISSLPAIGDAGPWASGSRGRLAMAQAMYNSTVRKAPAEGHTPLNWEDTLWGYILSSTSNFGAAKKCTGNGKIAPIADLVNHSDISNSRFDRDDETGELKISALRDIQPGEEVTISYKDTHPALFQLYGIVDPVGAPEQLPDSVCKAFGDAHLEQGTSPFLKTAKRFADVHCAASPPKVAAMSPLMALLQPFTLFLRPTESAANSGAELRRCCESSQACFPSGKYDFI